jgi:hypothetical protein
MLRTTRQKKELPMKTYIALYAALYAEDVRH